MPVVVVTFAYLLWYVLVTAGKPRMVRTTQQSLQKGDIIGVCLDLSIPQISFTVNGIIVRGFFRDFNVDGMFFPVISLSAKIRYNLVSIYTRKTSFKRGLTMTATTITVTNLFSEYGMTMNSR